MDELLTTFLGQCVTILVLNQSIEVEVGDALSNACFAYMEVGILFNSLPKIAFENSEPDVTLILDFVLVNDVEDHVIILVQFVHGVGVLVKDLNSKNAISLGNTGISLGSISTNCTHVEKFCGQHVNIALNRLAPRESRPFEILEIAHHVMHIPVGERGCSE
jgi:hypothetical protein